MTGERIEMCPSCGHMAHLAGECPSEMAGPYAECDCGYEPALPEAAPSTDEGEARKGHECDAWCVFQSWVSEIRGGAPNTDDLGLRSAFDAIAAEARAPLEERIRELEAGLRRVEGVASASSYEVDRQRAEAERLREALRMVRVRLAAGWVANPAVEEVAAELIWTTLAPPSSTEGTE